MKKEVSKNEYERLKKVLLTDKSLNPSRMTAVLTAEIKGLLSNYMDVSNMKISVNELDKGAELNIKVLVNKFYSLITSL